MKIGFEFHFEKKNNYSEEKFINIISERLSKLGKEMPINSVSYQSVKEGFAFLIDFQPVLSGITYQPILGCFGDLDRVYEGIDKISMPSDKMFQQQ